MSTYFTSESSVLSSKSGVISGNGFNRGDKFNFLVSIVLFATDLLLFSIKQVVDLA